MRDRWDSFYDQPIILNEPQAGTAIEGVIRQSSADEVAQLAVDTHGSTDYAIGLARILGFDLCPRLSHLRDRRLHDPQRHILPAELIAVTDRDVRMYLIESIWDELVRVAASVQTGQCTAVQALSRFGSIRYMVRNRRPICVPPSDSGCPRSAMWSAPSYAKHLENGIPTPTPEYARTESDDLKTVGCIVNGQSCAISTLPELDRAIDSIGGRREA